MSDPHTRPHQSEKEKEIFFEALEKVTPEERAEFLAAACSQDPALRARVEALLADHFRQDSFMKDAAVDAFASTVPAPPPAEAAAQVIARYKLLEKIGEGGFGEVWMAEQREPVRRRVALKLIKLGMNSRQIVARFEAERQALALMDHPNIAKIFDAGTTGTGRPYFVMELVRGIKITECCDQNQLPTKDRLDLFIKVCLAIQHAHHKGIIHRDIKPSNILVTLHDGVPVPKVIDFGIAKATQQELTDKTVFTQFQQFIGTPAYISPEQAEMSGLDIDTRADIYSLGVLLYELLVGQTPFSAKEMMEGGLDAMRQIIREREPQRPSTKLNTLAGDARTTTAKRRQTKVEALVHQIEGDLDWIVMKCLEKDRVRRYETATGLADDIRRYLANETVGARPPSVAYKIHKTWLRNKLAFTAITAVAVALVGGIGVSTWQAVVATRAKTTALEAKTQAEVAKLEAQAKQQEAEGERRRAEEQRQRAEDSEAGARQLLYGANMNLVQEAFDQDNLERARQLLYDTSTYSKRSFEWYYWSRQLHPEAMTIQGHAGGVSSVAFSPDSRQIATGGKDGRVKVWDRTSGELLLDIRQEDEAITVVAFSPDGERLLSNTAGKPRLRISSAHTGEELLTLRGVEGGAFAPDGQRIATHRDDLIEIWEISNGRKVVSLKATSPPWKVTSVKFSADGRSLVSSIGQAIIGPMNAGAAKLWDVETRNKRLSIQTESTVEYADISADNRRIFTITNPGGILTIWDAKTGDKLGTLQEAAGGVAVLALSPDGQQILTANGNDPTAKLWNVATQQRVRTLRGHRGPILHVAFSPNGQWLATAGSDGTVRLWDRNANEGAVTINVRTNANDLRYASVSPDGQRIVTANGSADCVSIWDTKTSAEVRTLPGYNWGFFDYAAFSPDGQHLITSHYSPSNVQVWDLGTGRSLFTLPGHGVGPPNYSPDGKRIAAGNAVWDAASGRELVTLTDDEVPKSTNRFRRWPTFSPNSQWILDVGGPPTKIWDAASGRKMREIKGPYFQGEYGDFSPDGQRIVTCSNDRSVPTVRVFDAANGTELLKLVGHKGTVNSVRFSPDGLRILTGSNDGTAKIWDAISGRELLTLQGHSASVRSAVFFPDGQRILTCSFDGTVKIWEAATPRQIAHWHQEENAAAIRGAEEQRELTRRMSSRVASEAERELTSRAKDPAAIKQWLVLAPIPFEGDYNSRDGYAALQREQLPDEAHLRPEVGERIVVAKGELGWTVLEQNENRIDFHQLLGKEATNCVVYAVAYVATETPQTGLVLNVGSDSRMKVFLNEENIYEQPYIYNGRIVEQQVPGLELNAGLNVLVVKIVTTGGQWSGHISLTDAAGRPANTLRMILDPNVLK